MTSEQIAFAYLVATCVAVGLGMGGGSNRPVAGCAVLVGMIYSLGAAIHVIAPGPIGFLSYPVLDTIGALAATAMWKRGAPAWVWWLSLAFWLQIGLSAAFWIMAWQRFGDTIFLAPPPAAFAAPFYLYKSGNNAVYIFELLLVGLVGGRHVVDRLRGLLSHHPIRLRWSRHPSSPEGA